MMVINPVMSKPVRYFFIFIIITAINSSCRNISREISGTWESSSINNPSPLFAKTLPSYEKGEVVLNFQVDGTFTWTNYREKLNLTGKYRIAGNKIHFEITTESSPLITEYKFKGKNLIIITDDGFTFTFLKKNK